MRRLAFIVAAALAACGGSSGGEGPPPGEVLRLANDGFGTGDDAHFQAGFVAGEEAAVTLGPVDRPFQLMKVSLLFGCGAGPGRAVSVRVYADEGVATPGALLYTADAFLAENVYALQEVDLSAGDVRLPAGTVRVSIRFQHDGCPSVARDDAVSSAGRNWIFAIPGGWSSAGALGVPGDWIIRAEVMTL